MTVAIVLMLAASTSAKWTYEVIEDDFDDTKAYSAIVFGEKKPLSTIPPMISLVCSNRGSTRPVLALRPGPFLGINRRTDVKLKIDDFPAFPFRARSTKGNHHIVAIQDLDAAWIRLMRAGNRIKIRVYDFQSNRHDASFTLSGFTAATNKLAAHCNMPRGWNEPEAPKIPAKENWIPLH